MKQAHDLGDLRFAVPARRVNVFIDVIFPRERVNNFKFLKFLNF